MREAVPEKNCARFDNGAADRIEVVETVQLWTSSTGFLFNYALLSGLGHASMLQLPWRWQLSCEVSSSPSQCRNSFSASYWPIVKATCDCIYDSLGRNCYQWSHTFLAAGISHATISKAALTLTWMPSKVVIGTPLYNLRRSSTSGRR